MFSVYLLYRHWLWQGMSQLWQGVSQLWQGMSQLWQGVSLISRKSIAMLSVNAGDLMLVTKCARVHVSLFLDLAAALFKYGPGGGWGGAEARC
jgi:hypothetical protein